MSNDSTKMFMNVVNERHDQYKARLDGLLDALSNNDQAKKLEACKALNDVSQSLASVLAEQDRPGWLKRTITSTSEYARKNKNPQSIASGSSWALLQDLMNLRQAAMAHLWSFKDSDEAAYDFDAVFQRARDNSNIHELFDSLISSLEKMLNEGEIDSVRANEALWKLISTLERNKKGSYFSTIASWQFARSFVKNAIWTSLDEVPVIKPIKAAFEKTLKDMDIEVESVHKEISEELKQRFEITPVESLTYDSNPLLADNSDSKE